MFSLIILDSFGNIKIECDKLGEDHENRVGGKHLKIRKLGKFRQSGCEHFLKLKAMKTMAHVIDSGRSEDTRSMTNDARCEFDSVTNQERERIVKYVFEEQRRRMSGGDR